MRDQPEGAELLREARKALLEELSAELPASRRYDVLLIANAMAIAAREIEAGDGREVERKDLQELLGSAVGEDSKTLVDRLAAEIRSGRRDGDVTTHALLSRDATARLKLSNPRLLAADNS